MKTSKSFGMLAHLLVLGFALTGIAAQAEEAPAPVLLESFACNFNDGKDMDDLLAARDYMVRQAEKAGIALAPIHVWTQFKGGPDLDLIWFTVHQDLTAYAAQSAAFGTAPEMSGVTERFDAVGSCDSNLAIARPVFQGKEVELPPTGPGFISANACMLRAGVRLADLGDLESHINVVVGGISAYDSTLLIMANPITSGPNSADLYLFSINESQTDWAAGVTAFGASPGGPGLARHFDSLLDCGTALWFSQQVIGGEDQN